MVASPENKCIIIPYTHSPIHTQVLNLHLIELSGTGSAVPPTPLWAGFIICHFFIWYYYNHGI